MPYLTRQEFLDQIVPEAVVSGLSDATIDEALEGSSREADSYLAKHYALPLIEWSSDLKRAVGLLAQYHLLSRKGFRPNSGNDQIAIKRYDDTVAWLTKISRGDCELVGCVDSTPDVDEDGPLMTESANGTFSYNTRRRSTGCCNE
jgi:phage gp36-like protein